VLVAALPIVNAGMIKGGLKGGKALLKHGDELVDVARGAGKRIIRWDEESKRFYNAITGRRIKRVRWPGKEGFLKGIRTQSRARVGQIVDRYAPIGYENDGRFLAPPGTPYEMRGIPGGYGGYKKYRVLKEFPWDKGITAPVMEEFGSPGGGIQYFINHKKFPQELRKLAEVELGEDIPINIQFLINHGYLEEVK